MTKKCSYCERSIQKTGNKMFAGIKFVAGCWMNTLKLLACFLVPISVVGLIIGILVCMSVGYFGVGMFCGFLAYTIFVFWWLMITGIVERGENTSA